MLRETCRVGAKISSEAWLVLHDRSNHRQAHSCLRIELQPTAMPQMYCRRLLLGPQSTYRCLM